MSEESNKAEGPESQQREPDQHQASEVPEEFKGTIRYRLKRARKWIIGVVVIGALATFLKGYLVDITKESTMSPKELVCIARDYLQTMFEEPPPEGTLYTVLLCDLAGDEGREVTSKIASILDRQDRVHLLTTCRTLRLEPYGYRSRLQARLRDKGQEWLEKRGADLLIYGVVDKRTPTFRLSFLPRRGELPVKDLALEGKEYNTDVPFPVNQDFSSQLTTAAAISLTRRPGREDENWNQRLKLEAEKLSQLIEHSSPETPEILAWRNHLYGDVAQGIALQDIDIVWLEKAINADREAIKLLDSIKDGKLVRLQAFTLNNLGNALRIKAKFTNKKELLGESRDALEKAIDAHKEAGQDFDAARAAHNLGLTLAALGDLNGAVSSLETALQIRTQKDWPAYWAATKSQWAIVKRKLGVETRSMEIIEEAVAAHRDVMTVWTQEKHPKHWGLEQKGLGDALLELGKYHERGSETQKETLMEAKKAYLAALDELPRKEVPVTWTKSQTGLAATLANLGFLAVEPEHKKELLLQAVQAHLKALEELTYRKDPKFWKGTHDNLAILLNELCNWPGGIPATDGFVCAEKNVRVSMDELRIGETEQNEWKKLRHAWLQLFLGDLLLTWGRCDDGPEGAEAIRRAKTAFEAATEEYGLLRMERGTSEAETGVVDAMEALARHPGADTGK